MCRAHQFVADPESEVKMARSGSRGDSSAATAWGLTRPSKLCPARSAMIRFQVRTFFSISSRQDRSCLRRSSGMSCFSVSRESPTRCASTGYRMPIRDPSMLISTPRAVPSSGSHSA